MLLMLLLLVLVLTMMLVLMLYHLIYLKVLEAQADLGLDVVTDGEMERGAYYMQVEYFRHFMQTPVLRKFHVTFKIFR